MNPGAKVFHIKLKFIKRSPDQPELIYTFMGSNDLGFGYIGGVEYNGREGEKLHFTPWLIF